MRLPPLILGFISIAVHTQAQQQVLAEPPDVRGPFTLTAVYDAVAGHNAFSYGGNTIPPVIHVLPGGAITVHYVNHLPTNSNEECATGPCANMTNLHFHGLHVSPNRPEDDVLTMMANPGESLDYRVVIPPYAPPGLYWYHTHPHGESNQQDLDGMSGAIVVDGIENYYPELRDMTQRVLILRDLDIEHSDNAIREQVVQQVELPSTRCGSASEQRPERVLTVNGQLRPQIPINPGERQFWRIVNASPDRYVDLRVTGEKLKIVALDGMPLSYHDPRSTTLWVDHLLLPPAGRMEAIVVGPPASSKATLRTACVDTGPDGDVNPGMVIADVGSAHRYKPENRSIARTKQTPVYREAPQEQIKKLQASQPDFVVTFTEDKKGFYINGQKFSMESGPMVRVKVGSMQHWRVVNATKELHPFHIHQVHFLAYAENGIPLATPEWLDTVNVPFNNGTVDLIMDFTDPVIKGTSVFHCHLLNHEDKGMMAKILFVDPKPGE